MSGWIRQYSTTYVGVCVCVCAAKVALGTQNYLANQQLTYDN